MRYLKDSEKQYLKEAIDRNVFYIFTGNTFEYLECDNDVKRSINTHYIEKLTKEDLKFLFDIGGFYIGYGLYMNNNLGDRPRFSMSKSLTLNNEVKTNLNSCWKIEFDLFKLKSIINKLNKDCEYVNKGMSKINISKDFDKVKKELANNGYCFNNITEFACHISGEINKRNHEDIKRISEIIDLNI